MSCRQLWMLRQIGNGITRADPQLAEMISIFAWLTSGEQMPAHERLRTPLSQPWNGLLSAGCRIGTLATRTLPRLQAARPVLLHLGARGTASILHARQLPWQYTQSRPLGPSTRRQTCNSSLLPPAGFAAPRGAASARSLTPSATRCGIRKGTPDPSGNRASPAGTAMACRAPPAPRWRLRASDKPPETRQRSISRRQGSGHAGHAGGPTR